eukprot:scaffold129008_cov105-Phaeocystis_antarctica.AAC.4
MLRRIRVDGSCYREHVAAVAIVLAMHLSHGCVPGAAGIARRGAREVAKSAAAIRLVTFFESGGSPGSTCGRTRRGGF